MRQRSLEQLRNHFEVEKGLADQLRAATREERTLLFRTMYDTLFSKVPDHPRLERQHDPAAIDGMLKRMGAATAECGITM